MLLSKSPSKDFSFPTNQLSWVGRCTLNNSVAQIIPNCTMSSFKVPIFVCDKLDVLTRKFWWRAWDKLSASKATGGLGFKRAKIVIMLYFQN